MSGDELLALRAILPAGHPLEPCVREGLRRERPVMQRRAEAREAARRARESERESLRQWATGIPLRHRAVPRRPALTAKPTGRGRPRMLVRDMTTGHIHKGRKAAADVAGIAVMTLSRWLNAGRRFERVTSLQTDGRAA